MVDPGLYISDRHERSKKPKDESWKRGPKITLKDCINGTGEVQKTTLKEILGNKFVEEGKMGFGKYRDLSYKEVKEKDRDYWEWALENIGTFEAKVRKTNPELLK